MRNYRMTIRRAAPAVLALTVAGLIGPAEAGGRAGAEVFAPATAEAQASARLVVRVSNRRQRAALQTFTVRARHLAADTTYRLFLDDPNTADDPTPIEVATGTTNRRGRLSFRFGKRRAPLPFGATAAELAGGRIELRDESGSVVLGTVVPQAGKRSAATTTDDPVCVDRDGVQDCAPTADAGADASVECNRDGVDVTLDGTASADPEGADLIYVWTGPFTEGTARGATPTVTFTTAGVHRVTLVVSDGYFRSAPDEVEISVVDTTPPRIAAPADVVAESTAPSGTPVRLGTPEVFDSCDADPDVANDAPAAFPMGDTVVTWTATDDAGNQASDTQLVTVVDTAPPTLTIDGLPTELWAPNHKLHHITPRIVLRDLSDPDPELTVEVTSNEPDNGLGDGDTTGDIVIHSPRDIELRAERSGPGSGRVYTLVWTARDAAGNETEVTRTVTVPHSRGSGNGRP